MLELIKWIAIVLGLVSAPLMIWMLVFALRGLGRMKEPEQIEQKLHRFAVIVCARNEENVIGNLLQSLKQQDYAGEYKVFVIADNCTDKTAQVAEQNGATVFKRFDEIKRGKGYALQYGIDRITKMYADSYDAICVFDADNLASAVFLTEMNIALCSGGDVGYGYRDSKNIHDSWISEVYALYWLMLMRFFHCPRHAMKLSAIVGGTGFAFKLSALKETGWQTYSLTEDIEFSIQQILAGHNVVPTKKAVFYDEQPTEFNVSVKQRLRWMIGHIQCLPIYFPQIIKFFGKSPRRALDLLCYILFIPVSALAIPTNVLGGIALIGIPGLQPFALPVILGGLVLCYVFALFIAYMTIKLERKDTKRMARAILLYPIFMFTMLVLALVALIRPKTDWVPIQHKSTRTIEEIE